MTVTEMILAGAALLFFGLWRVAKADLRCERGLRPDPVDSQAS